MARATVVWQGLNELKDALRTLPETMTGEAAKLAESNANSAALDIRGSYPVRTGNLRNGVKVEVVNTGRTRTGRRVINRAPHAVLFERGTVARHYITVNGVKHLTGAMKPGHVFVPRIIKWRRRFLDAVKVALARQGGRAGNRAITLGRRRTRTAQKGHNYGDPRRPLR